MSIERRIEALEAALWAQQEAVEIKAEHYRQHDNGWLPSPGFGYVRYGDVTVAQERAANLRYEALGINKDWKPKRPNLAPSYTTGRNKPIMAQYYWIVDSQSPIRDKVESTQATLDMPHG